VPLRSRALFLLLFSLLFAGCSHNPAPVATAPPLLQVHVFERGAIRSRRSGYFRGEGKANLIEGNSIKGFEFSYDCPYKFHSSDEDAFYPAQWKVEGLKIYIITPAPGTDKEHLCELKMLMKDFVYRRINGKLVTMSVQEYASRDEARVERARSLAPADLDPSHYPVNIALLHLTWTGEVSGVHTGTGQGNLKTETGINAVDFSLHCPIVVQPTPDGRYLLGRWLQPGTHLQLLLRSIDVDGAPGATCDVTTVVEPDVYIRTGSTVKAIPQQEYRAKYASSGSSTP